MTIADVVGITVVTKHVDAGVTPGDLGVSKAFGMQQTKPATWEGSVLPALREALAKLGEPVDREGMTSALDYLATDQDPFKGVRLDTMAEVLEDVAQAAERIRTWRADARAQLAARPPCPVCQAMPGWVCGLCREPEQAAPIAAPADSEPQAPEGFTFTMTVQGHQVYVVSEEPGPDGWVGAYYWGDADPVSIQANTSALRWPPHTERARQHAARLLGQAAPPLRGAPTRPMPLDPREQLCAAGS